MASVVIRFGKVQADPMSFALTWMALLCRGVNCSTAAYD